MNISKPNRKKKSHLRDLTLEPNCKMPMGRRTATTGEIIEKDLAGCGDSVG